MDLTLLRDFGIAFFIGALVGIDREKRKISREPGGVGGLRTFILLAEAGAICGWLTTRGSLPWLFEAGGALVLAILIAGYLVQSRAAGERPGVTTLVAGWVVYLLGGMVLLGHAQAAVALAIATSAVLVAREPLHLLVRRIDRDDLYAGLKLLAASCIILPVIPNQTIDPWEAINPYKIWLLVILISALSLAGYVLARTLGPERSAPLAGFTGGLVSSTVVTLEFTRRSREDRESSADALACGILLAWLVMAVRVVVLAWMIHPPAGTRLLLPIGVLAVVTALAAGWYWRATRADSGAATRHSVALKNPFNLVSAIKFAGLFTAILLVVKIVQAHSSGGGIYAVAALAGLTDVDAITLSMADLAKGGAVLDMTVRAIVIAALANTLCKAGIAVVGGGPGLRNRILRSSTVAVAATVLALLAI